MTSNFGGPLRLRLLNDFEVIVAGVRAMLVPFADRVRVVETDVDEQADRRADVTLYDTFGATMIDRRSLGEVLADDLAGKVVVYSWNLEAALVATALAAGCRGYLSKGLDAEQLVDLLERIAGGDVISPADYHETAISEAPQRAWPGKHAGLTLRESEVVSLVAQGLTNPEIAEHCYITQNSLKTYIRAAYRKIGVERRSQAVRWGIENGMLPG